MLSSTGCERLLDQVGLAQHRVRSIRRFSHGMRQRLGLARALIGTPELLVLDEPTNGLDPRGRRELHDLLLELVATRQVAVLMCTHLLDDVERLCHRAGVIVEGRTVAEGRLRELMRCEGAGARFRLRLSRPGAGSPIVPYGVKLIGEDGDWRMVELACPEQAETAWAELFARGWPITEIRAEQASLEPLCLALTEGRRA